MATIFDTPGWQEHPDLCLQGTWYRFMVERPDGNGGWVGVLDSAALRHPRADLGVLSAHHHLTGVGATEQAAGRHMAYGIQHYEGILSEGLDLAFPAPAPGQDLPTSSWVGEGWVKGWETDILLDRGHVYLGTPEATDGDDPIDGRSRRGVTPTQAIVHGMYTRCLDDLQEAGFPYGLGWGMPDMPFGREVDRLPWEASAHLRLEAAERFGPPRPWDTRTARFSWALMGRLRSDLAMAQAA